jgi:hypothetical protein
LQLEEIEMDNDTIMLNELSAKVNTLDIKYKMSSFEDQAVLGPPLSELWNDWVTYRIKLMKAGVITTDEDLAEMETIKEQIDAAADRQAMILAIARTIAFIATKV